MDGQHHLQSPGGGRRPVSNVLAMMAVGAAMVLAQISHADASEPFVLIDAGSGAVLGQGRATDRWYPASLTKLMTAYTVLREIDAGRISLRSPVRISANAEAEPPSKMGFPWKTVLTVEAALQIIMVKSANDVSTALGESAGGSEEAFAWMMNRYAREIGMEHSNWVNAHGLHDEAQYSTARDMAILAKELLDRYPQHRDLFALAGIKFANRVHRNHNALLRQFPGTTGMKTGFICAGGLNLVATARRDGRELIAVVLGHTSSKARNTRAAELLTHGFGRIERDVDFTVRDLAPKGAVAGPFDISEQVCGRGGRKGEPEFDTSDLASEFFALRSEPLEERYNTYLSQVDDPGPVVTVSLGGADGPDPFFLLKERPPMALAMSDEVLIERVTLGDGERLAVPVSSPLAAPLANAVAAVVPERRPEDVPEGAPAVIAVTDEHGEPLRAELAGGMTIALPTVRPAAEEQSDTGGRQPLDLEDPAEVAGDRGEGE